MNTKKMLLFFILLVLLIVTSLYMAKTYARYYSEANGNAEAVIAKWSFLVNGEEETITPITFEGTAKTTAGLDDGVIAPGTSGEFEVKIDATGTQTGLQYNIKFDEFNGKLPTNLLIKVDGETVNIADGATYEGFIYADNPNKTVTKTITWEWPYRTGTTEEEKLQNDATDTREGKQTNLASKFKIKVSGTQVEPNIAVNP